MVFGGPSAYESSLAGGQPPSPPGPERAIEQPSFLLFWGARRRVWVSLPVRFYVLFPYVSGVYYLRF